LADPDWEPLRVLFADDEVVRRIALVSAGGLLLTAFIFFRPPLVRARNARLKSRPTEGGNIAGA
jgi:hypothetical protein